MKVKVKEEPAWKRVLEIEVDASVVDQELDQVVKEFRRRLVLPGFRKGHVPEDLAKRHLGDDLEGEVLRRVLPNAFEEAIRKAELKPIGDPQVKNLRFAPGEPLKFTATVEVMPEVEIKEYDGLKLTREQAEITDEDVNRVLDQLREQHADLEEVSRPAQGGDVLTIGYWEVENGPSPEKESPSEMNLTLGSEHTPESFNKELMGSVVGDMKKIPLTYPPDYQDQELAGTTREIHVTLRKIQEKIWPPLEPALAQKILGNEESTVEDLKSRVRLNLEVEARMRSIQTLENNMVQRLLELNPFEVPQGLVENTLDRILADAKNEENPLPPDEESRLREAYRSSVEHRYRTDILVEAVGRQEEIQVSEEDLAKEIEAFAEQEGKKPSQIKANLKREGNLDRLRQDLFRRRVIDRLVEKADVTVTKAGEEKA